MSKQFIILLSAGESHRMGGVPKQYLPMRGFPLFYFSLKNLTSMERYTHGAVVVKKGDRKKVEGALKSWGVKNCTVVEGGASRQKSMEKGMKTLEKAVAKISPRNIIVIHNAANPHATPREFEAVAVSAEKHGAAAVGHPVVDTLKRVEKGKIVKTVDRKNLWHMQTPQAFRYEIFQKAQKEKILDRRNYTDEMGWIEALGIQPVVIEASPENRKITTMQDMPTRTGIGLDSHRFEKPSPVSSQRSGLVLGGLHLRKYPKFRANSDGDVMLHALCNALLCALGEGSFSTIADPMCARGITDSRKYLKKILTKVRKQNLTLTHVGFQFEGREPRIDPLTTRLKSSLSKILYLAPEHIGITATTGEDLTHFGRGEGLQCFAVATLQKKSL